MNDETKKAVARLRAINYQINRHSEYMKQPELEKLLAEKEQLKKVLKCQQ